MPVTRRASTLILALLILIPFLPSSPILAMTADADHRDVTLSVPAIPLDGFRSDSAQASRISFFNGEDNWVSFISGATPGTQLEVLPKSRDTQGLCVDSNFFGMYKIAVTVNKTTFHHLHIPGAGHTFEVGKPAVPMVTRYLEIPHGIDLSLEILYKDERVLDGYYVIPAQEPYEDMPNATEPSFSLDAATYSTDTFFPSSIAQLEGADGSDPIIIRGHRILGLTLYPVQFNPVTQQVKVHSKIEVRINYNRPARVEAVDERLYSPAFEELCEAFIINYKYGPSAQSTPTARNPGSPPSPEEGAEYLIITNDTFFQQVQVLADWKEKKGITTKIVRTSDIKNDGPSADDIANYIKNAYDTWNPAPSYLLLVGDSDFLPTHYRNPHPSPAHGGFNIPTDLYYATVDGNDYFPDMYVGRLSVDTAAQATTVINKIINYERNPPADTAFYSHVTACAYFQDNDADGFEDRGYVVTVEEIRDFLVSHGYNVFRVYWADPAVNPTNYNNGAYDNGDALPVDLLRANGFAWDGDATDITNNITAGTFLIYHRDHGLSQNFWHHVENWWGWYDGWSHPHYTTGDVAGLANAPLLPVLFSLECQGGWFDGETDQTDDPVLVQNFECYCEEFVRQPGGGAVAAIGSTRNSPSRHNDVMAKGLFDAIWPNFDTAFAPSELYSLGQVLTYGKVYLASHYSYANPQTEEMFQLYHLFGDPELSIWTAKPSGLTVNHPTTIGSGGTQKFIVTVEDEFGDPVHHARVCIRKDADVYAVTYTDTEGQAYFEITPSSGGQMDITVTRHNYIPYEGRMTVTDGGATLSVDPAIGPSGISVKLEGSNFDDGEDVAIYFGGVTPDTTVAATGGSFTLDPFAVPAGDVGPVNVVAVGQTSGRTAVTLFRRLPDQPLPDPYLYCQWDPSTWHLNPAGGDPRWNNPDIQLFETATGNSVASDDLTVGVNYTVRVTLHNDATVDATDTKVTFQWAFWGAGQKTWHLFGTDTVTVPAGGTATAEATWAPSITGHTCIVVTIDHPWDENLDNNKGQENTHVHPVASPGEITFTLSNPTETSALIYLEARQVGEGSLWPAEIKRDYPQIQGPGQNRTVTLTVEAPDEAQEGEKRIFTVDAYIDGELIGGIEIEVVVSRETTRTEPPVPGFPPAAILIGVISALVLTVVVRRRRWPNRKSIAK